MFFFILHGSLGGFFVLHVNLTIATTFIMLDDGSSLVRLISAHINDLPMPVLVGYALLSSV